MKNIIKNRQKVRRRGKYQVFNHPSKIANEKANELIRKLENGKIVAITTGNGQKIIKFKLLEDGNIYLLTEAGEMKDGDLKSKCQRISVNTLKHACYELLLLKTVTRNDFEKFSNYWSSLFALLITVFFDVIKKHRTPKGTIRITLIGSRVYFSGLSASAKTDWNAIENNGAAFALMTFTDIKQSDTWKEKLLEYNIDKVMLDNGMFKYFNDLRKGKKGIKPEINEYIDFINENKELFSYVINIDDPDPKITDSNQKLIEQKTGIRPVPVWHPGEDSSNHNWKRLEDMVEQDHAVIAIGKTVFKGESYKKELFNELFRRHPEQNFHWLGGASQLILEYDWFSSDVSSWWKGREAKPQLTVLQGFKASTKRLPEGVVTKEEGLTFNIQMLQNIEYMNWPMFKRKPIDPPFPELSDLWRRVYDSEKARPDSSKSKKKRTSTYVQLNLFDDELVS